MSTSSSLRIFIAILLSALMHAAILWLPYLRFPHKQVILPPLTVRLELPAHPVDKTSAKLTPPNLLVKSGKGSANKETATTAKSMKEMEKSATNRQFPKHLQLTFTVFRGADISRVGKLLHQLDLDGDAYTLTASQQTTGLTSLESKEKLTQISKGKIGEHGLQPALLEIALPVGTQDNLSFMYQLSQLSIPSMRMEFFPLSISDGAHLEQIQIEIGSKEEISTPMGNLRTLHLRKMHSLGEAYFEIWLGMDYRMLPVKFRQVDSSGNEIEEFVISDIRAADEP